jgi:hypothetical protein
MVNERDRDETLGGAIRELRRDIAAGLDQLDRGQSAALDIAEIKTKARQRFLS